MTALQTDAVLCGDNLSILKTIPDGVADLIYLDPPYNSGLDYRTPDGTVQFSDKFKSPAHYIGFMRPILAECIRILKPGDSSLYVHVDDSASARLKILLDDELMPGLYRNTIIWERTTGKNNGERRWGRACDHILFYGSRRLNTEAVQVAISDVTLKNYKYRDGRGMFQRLSLFAPGVTVKDSESGRPWRGISPPEGRRWHLPKTGDYAEFIAKQIPEYASTDGIFARLELLDGAGFLAWPYSGSGQPRLKHYWIGGGCNPSDLWTDIKPAGQKERERAGKYPTQKPEALLERIVLASSNENDLVLDPFCGSGTSLVAAKKLGRKYLGVDSNEHAVEIAAARLSAL